MMSESQVAVNGVSQRSEGTIVPRKLEHKHYHVYLGYRDPYRGIRMFGTLRKARFESRSQANRWAEREQPDKRLRFVQRCDFDPEDCPSRERIHIAERRSDR